MECAPCGIYLIITDMSADKNESAGLIAGFFYVN